MRDKPTIPQKVLQAFLDAALMHGIPEAKAKEFLHWKQRERLEKNSPSPSMEYLVRKANSALGYSEPLDYLEDRDTKRILEALYRAYILGEEEDSDIPVLDTLPQSTTQPDDNKPLILRDLSPDFRFIEFQEFLESLEVHEGKLVWPNSKSDNKATLVRKLDLALFIYHLNMKEGFQFELSDWASYGAKCFVWQDHSPVSNAFLLNKFNRYNYNINELSDSRITRMIQGLYAY